MIRIGDQPFLECSTKGDRRFSAFCARIRGRNNRSIEDIYQGAKVFQTPNGETTTGLSWREAKGKDPINREEVAKLYKELWREYLLENPDLVAILKEATGLSDMFGQKGRQCQALTLWELKHEF